MDLKISEIVVWYASLGWAWKVVIAWTFCALFISAVLVGFMISADVPYWFGKPRLTSEVVFETYCGKSNMVVEHHELITNSFGVKHGDGG